MALFILPTVGTTRYRGKYPTRARWVSSSRSQGRYVELNNGVRLWSIDDRSPEFNAAGYGDDYASCLARAVRMTDAQYATLQASTVGATPADCRAARLAIQPDCNAALAGEYMAAAKPAVHQSHAIGGTYGNSCERCGCGSQTLTAGRPCEPSEAGAAFAGSPDPVAPTFAYVVACGEGGTRDLCEGGVYSSAPPAGECEGNTLVEAHAAAARLNVSAVRARVVSHLNGATVSDAVASSLAGWQLDAVAGERLGHVSRTAVRRAQRALSPVVAPATVEGCEPLAFPGSPAGDALQAYYDSDRYAAMGPARHVATAEEMELRDACVREALLPLLDMIASPEGQAGFAAAVAGVVWWNNPHPSGSREAYRWDAGHKESRAIMAMGRHKEPRIDVPRTRPPALGVNDGPRMVANTTRAVYWLTHTGYVATHPDHAPARTAGAWSRLDSLMRAKGESDATVARVCGHGSAVEAR